MKLYVGNISRIDYPSFVLTHSTWDDWFSYATTYNVVYHESAKTSQPIGQVKIGQKGLKESRAQGKGARTPNLPHCFDALGSAFFSIGQDDYYYENLNHLSGKTSPDIRKEYLIAIRDMAYDLSIFEENKAERVTITSLMRSVSETTIRGQFNRMAHGGARLTEYQFTYRLPSVGARSVNVTAEVAISSAEISFQVTPESVPPTNIHVVIGRNGVGKTHLIKSMIDAAFGEGENKQGLGFFYQTLASRQIPALNLFANFICIGFSAFDNIPRHVSINEKRYVFVGLDDSFQTNLKHSRVDNTSPTARRIDSLSDSFVERISSIVRNTSKTRLWENAIDLLSYDDYFSQSAIADIVKQWAEKNRTEGDSKAELKRAFSRLSSGHKIVLLTVASLVDEVVEKSFVILDEPETHLHPPLLSALIRAVSEVLIQKNGVALVATHSPVVLQEVPASCCWEMQRSGAVVSLRRLSEETFGADINSLMRSVFGLEVLKSGFHQMIVEALEESEGDFSKALSRFGGKLGTEGLLLLKARSANYKVDDYSD